jgi:TusA-related sulfurtransferase
VAYYVNNFEQPIICLTKKKKGKGMPGEVINIAIDKELNLKGKICPYTFIETMLTLEEMEPEKVLRVIIDYPPAACEVPQSLKNEGYEILEVFPINGTDWAILVKNKEIE